MHSNKQADGEIHEDQLLNFLVNRLDEEVPLSLANNAEIAAEDIYEVLVGACADGTSVSTLCASSQNAPAANTILYHLRTKFEPDRLERVANTLLRKDLDELLPEQVEVCADLHLRPSTVTKTIQTDSSTQSQSAEPPRSMPTRHSTRV